MQGNVIQLPKNGEPGKIRFKQTKQDFLFNWEDVKGDNDSLKEGQEVDFNQSYRSGEKWAVKIRPIGGARQERQKAKKTKAQRPVKPPKPVSHKPSIPPQGPRTPPIQSQGPPVEQQPSQLTQPQNDTSQANTGFTAPSTAQPEPRNGFVNPYNFVPLGEKEPKREKPESHEYFIGKSGRITCKLILKTPFFTPHPERQWQVPEDSNLSSAPSWMDKSVRSLIGDAKEHDVLGLLRDYNGNPFISGSSLKGAFRTVAEALSNSCLGVIDFQWEMLGENVSDEVKIKGVANYFSNRIIRSPKSVGRVVKLPSQDGVGKIEVGQKLRVFYDNPHGFVGAFPPTHSLAGRKDRETTQATRQVYHQTPRRFEVPTAKNLDVGSLSGELKITEVIDKKKSQRFIYWQNNPPTVNFSLAQEFAYNRANEVGIDDEKDMTGHIACDPSHAGMRSQRHKLRVGDLVYFNEEGGQVQSIGPVELYRVLYKHSLDAVLLRKHQDFLTCDKSDNLCPCCRIFGWVPPTGDEETSTTSRKGFVHFSTATIEQQPEEIQTQWVTLKPLGKPHPSCWQFYLKAKDVGDDAGYNDDNATINGRKFYWHQPGTTADSVKDERKTEQRQPQPPDNQNKTVELLLPKTKQNTETTFTFTVDFENLSEADLGLLLLTLQPNLLGEGNIPSDKLYHHFGMGKPLGLGSAEVSITELTLIDRARRYQSLTDDGETPLTNPAESETINDLINAFVATALSNQGKPSGNDDDSLLFATMKHIEALLLMLDFENTPESVQYPPGDYPDTRNHSKKYWESFNWFTHENQRAINRRKHLLWTPRDISGDERRNPKRQDAYPPQRLSQPERGNQSTPRRGGRYRQRGRRG